MSTQEKATPEKSIRSIPSLLAEAIIAKAQGWKIHFLSGGYGTFPTEKVISLLEQLHQINGEKLWLNMGTLTKKQLEAFHPYIEGYAGTIETINDELRKKVCPSKPIEPILRTFKACDELNIKKAITIIVGLGETEEDIPKLIKFIKEHKIDRITFYALNPVKGTPFRESPDINYYTKWISETRKEFPDLEIITGIWKDKINYLAPLLEAGANHYTKLPAMKIVGSEKAKQLKEEVEKADREQGSNFLSFNTEDIRKLVENQSEEVKKKVKAYIK